MIVWLTNREALGSVDFWHNRLNRIQKFFAKNIDMLCIDGEKDFTFCESNHNVIIRLDMKDGCWRVCRLFEVFIF